MEAFRRSLPKCSYREPLRFHHRPCTAAFAGWPFSDTAAYGSLVGGAFVGLTVALWPWPTKPRRVIPYESDTGPTPAMREAYRVYQRWQDDKLRQAVEPHAARLGVSTDVLVSAYADIKADMERVGAV